MIINFDTSQTAKLDADAIPFENALPTEEHNDKHHIVLKVLDSVLTSQV